MNRCAYADQARNGFHVIWIAALGESGSGNMEVVTAQEARQHRQLRVASPEEQEQGAQSTGALALLRITPRENCTALSAALRDYTVMCRSWGRSRSRER